MPTRFIYLSLPCTTALRGTGERGLELMSRQIEVRLWIWECSQLEEDTFISSYWVSQSLYGIGGVAGGPPSNEATPSSLPHSSSQRLPHQKKREPQPVENVCLLQPNVRPTLGQMPERDPLRYSFLLYIDPDPVLPLPTWPSGCIWPVKLPRSQSWKHSSPKTFSATTVTDRNQSFQVCVICSLSVTFSFITMVPNMHFSDTYFDKCCNMIISLW